jgi:hypothetical protein
MIPALMVSSRSGKKLKKLTTLGKTWLKIKTQPSGNNSKVKTHLLRMKIKLPQGWDTFIKFGKFKKPTLS